MLLLSLAALTAVSVVRAATYDYIVVGSGPGGGPLAANLAKAGYSTLLIEAGGDEGSNPTYADIANFLESANDEASRWDFFVKHSDDPKRDLQYKYNTWDTGDGTFYVGRDPPAGAKLLGIQYPRAAVLGGCAMHNAGVASLAQDDDWNFIANQTGDASWEASKMARYFREIEKNHYRPSTEKEHGFNGWLSTNVGDPSWAKAEDNPGTRMLKRLGELLGQNTTTTSSLLENDILAHTPGKDQISSVYNMAYHIDAIGKRSSPNNYLRATLADPAKYPLTLALRTLVTKVLFSNATVPRAIGVEIMEGASLYTADPKHVPGSKGPVSQVYAAKEVIIAGGVFNSPQILKLSGIGPKAELEKFGIKVVKDLPGVGENMGDNYEASILGSSAQPIPAGLSTAMFRTQNAATKNRNIYAWCGPFSFEGMWPGFPNNYPNQWSCAVAHIGPKSHKGTVKLVSANPQDRPDINLHLFAENGEADVAELSSAISLLRASWLPAAGTSVAPIKELHPCPGEIGKALSCTEEAQREFIKLQVYSHHATSSCAIGADGNPMAVLDSKFRVRGVAGLRVVDGSALPVVPGAFPVVPTMMISQKATEDVLADAKKWV
ncbi:hypothetical protein B0T18DRAFT_436560 [Schizothecium vesticola]|uniref:Alcohol oxidase n=1 Tax=Schizothecium vesticola TaxID=314040 RepID=A0AA40F7C4_9PEZI|nr:hypothetical protein B0T18DRAFT_436560 [Schizothecium vesticola]